MDFDESSRQVCPGDHFIKMMNSLIRLTSATRTILAFSNHEAFLICEYAMERVCHKTLLRLPYSASTDFLLSLSFRNLVVTTSFIGTTVTRFDERVRFGHENRHGNNAIASREHRRRNDDANAASTWWHAYVRILVSV